MEGPDSPLPSAPTRIRSRHPASPAAPRARGSIQPLVAVLSSHPSAARAAAGLSLSGHSPLALWHLLSLDAPTVAALWTWFIAASVHIRLPAISILSMAIAVWMLYAADRLLDARHLLSNPLHTGDLEHRHRFHHRYRPAFLLGILLASIALSVLIPRLDPRSLRLDLILGALLAGYFILIHATGSAHRLPKEIAVGLFFSAAVFIPTVGRAPQLRPSLAPIALLFALLCSLNCLFIYAWEHMEPQPESPQNTSSPHLLTRLALAQLPAISALCVLSAVALAFCEHRSLWPPLAATALSATVLTLLHDHRSRLAPTTRRAAADLALLTPLFLLPALR